MPLNTPATIPLRMQVKLDVSRLETFARGVLEAEKDEFEEAEVEGRVG